MLSANSLGKAIRVEPQLCRQLASMAKQHGPLNLLSLGWSPTYTAGMNSILVVLPSDSPWARGVAQRLIKVRRDILLPMQFFFGGWFFFWLSLVCEYLWLKPRRQKTRSSPFRAHLRFKKKRREKSFLCLLLYLNEPHVTS